MRSKIEFDDKYKDMSWLTDDLNIANFNRSIMVSSYSEEEEQLLQ